MSQLIIYVHDFRSSGVVRDALALAAYCHRHREVWLIAGYGGAFLEEEARALPCHVLCLRERPWPARGSRLAPVLALRRHLRERGPCVLLSMGNLGHATPFLASLGLPGVRRIYRISNEVARADGLRGRIRTFWMRMLIRDAASLPLVGASLGANPLFADALQVGRAVQMASGVDVARARTLAAETAPHPWLTEDVPVVMAVGRLRPQKNLGLLIDAVGLLRERRQRVRLVIVGGGTAQERAELAAGASRAGLGADFLLAGESRNVFSWLARASVFVLPSRWEGSSLALLEAMAVGTPVVASVLAGDARQVLEDGRHGRLFDGRSPQDLASAIGLQLSNDAIPPGERAAHFGEPWQLYVELISRVESSATPRRSGLRNAARGVRRRSMFLLVRWLVRWTGFDGARRIGPWLGVLHYYLGRRTRCRCQKGLAALMDRRPSDPAVRRTLREAYRVNTIAAVEVLSMVDRRLDAQRLPRLCRVEGVERLAAARQGHGAILLATHSGNSLLLAASLVEAGIPVTVVYRHTRMMSKEFFAAGLPRYGFEAILANEGFRAYTRMVDALRNNRVMFAMIDQGVAEAETGLPLRFLGKVMPMPGGIVQLARHSRAPILPVTTLAADPLWRFAIESPLSLPPGGAIAEDTATILAHLEQGIRQRPHLWSWPHRRWRNFPLAGSAA